MRIFVFPLAALAILAGGNSGDEPSESQMKQAFATSLSAQVQDVMQFVSETNGADAAMKIQRTGGDRFVIRRFHKIECTRRGAGRDYVCDFLVDIELSNGSLERQLSGRFSAGADGVAFLDRV
ncbi:MAG TPA: hypothetical protein VFA53_11005 [Xanthobacteraceae bacterium]|nr:hypothetical protein [Xanthobacteraceae bacterium]